MTRTCLCVSGVRMVISSLRDVPGARAPASSLTCSCLQRPVKLGMGAWLEKHNNSTASPLKVYNLAHKVNNSNSPSRYEMVRGTRTS